MTKQQAPMADDTDFQNLAQVADDTEAAQMLYGHAIEGFSHSIERDIQELENYGLEEHLTKAEEEVATMAVGALEEDVKDLETVEGELVEDDALEDQLLAEDEEPLVDEPASEVLQ